MHETMAVAAAGTARHTEAERSKARPSEERPECGRGGFPLLGLAPRRIFSAEFRQGEEGGDSNLNRVGRSSCSGGSFGKAGARCHSGGAGALHRRAHTTGGGIASALMRLEIEPQSAAFPPSQQGSSQQGSKGSKPCQAPREAVLADLSSTVTTFFHHFFHHFCRGSGGAKGGSRIPERDPFSGWNFVCWR
ncbi:hypothetical protein L1887_59690 [Cichorium endivia]|nr:hypothetical protein L1887_59690 [Cichorium endivia]